MARYKLYKTSQYEKWVRNLDAHTRSRINLRLTRACADGHLGDHHGVGDGISEMRLDFGPGYRVYYTIREDVVLLLLVGGDKSGQQRDIERARDMLPEALEWLKKELAKEEEEEQ